MTSDTQARLESVLRNIVTECFPQEGHIPPRDGGPIFRDLASRFRVSEKDVSGLAQKLGYWPHSLLQMEQAFEGVNMSRERVADFLDDPLAIRV